MRASRNGWPLLFIGLFLATFIGGGVRTFFSPRQLRLWVDDQIEKTRPPFDLRFEDIRLSLRRGLLPRLGIELSGVDIRGFDSCKAPFDLRIEDLYLPLEVISASRARIFFKTIQASRVFVLQKPSCPSESVTPISKDNFFLDNAQRFIETRWEQEMAATRRLVRGVEIDQLVYVKEGRPLFEIGGLEVSFRHPEQFSLNAYFTLHSLQQSLPELKPFFVEAQITRSNISSKISTRLNEGMVALEGFVQLKDFEFKQVAQVTNLPLRPIVRVLDENLFFGFSQKWPRYSWVSGKAQVQARFDSDWRSIEMNFKKWQIQGDDFNGVIEEIILRPFSNSRSLVRAEVLVQDLNAKFLNHFWHSFLRPSGQFTEVDKQNTVNGLRLLFDSQVGWNWKFKSDQSD